MFCLIRVLLVTINNQSRSWSSIHRCSDWSGPNLSLSTTNGDLDHPYTDVLTDQGLTCHYQQSMKILIILTQMFWLIRALLVIINNQWRSWSSIHRCSDWSGPYLSLSTINQDLDHPYTDVLTDQGLTGHYQQSIKILIIHTQMFWLIRALLVTINNQSRYWSSIHRYSVWSGPYLSLSTIWSSIHRCSDWLLVTINNQSRSWSFIHRCSDWWSLSTINQMDLDHPYTDVLTDQGLTCHYQQSIKILIIHDQGLTCHYQQSIKILIIHTQMFWLITYLSLSTINQDLDHPYTDVLTDQGLTCHYQQSTCHYQQSIKILIIHTQMFWPNLWSWRSWSSIHRCSDWSGPNLSLSTINEDIDHSYTDVLTDQGTCHYQQSRKILVIHTQMFWLIRALLIIHINNQSRSWSYWSHTQIFWCSDQGLTCHNQSRSWSSINQQSMKILISHTQMFWLINGDIDHPDQGLTCHYQQLVRILIINTQMFCLIRALLVTINNQWSLDHPYTDVLTDQGLTCHYQQSIKILIIHTQITILILIRSSIHLLVRSYQQSMSLSTINGGLDHPYTDVLTDQGLTCHYQQSIKILIIHTQMFWLTRALLVTINNQSRSWSSIHRCSDWSGPYLWLSTINQDQAHPYTDVLTDQGLTCHCQQSIKILIIHTQMFWLIRALLVTINNQSRSWSSIHRCSVWSSPLLSLSTIKEDLGQPNTDNLTDQRQ